MRIHDWSKVDPGLFHHFHLQWIASLSTALNGGVLPPDYYALAEQRTPGREPDVLALHLPVGHADSASGNGGTALATAPPKTKFVQQSDADVYAAKANRIVIRNSEGDVVAIVEIVSPGNKHSRASIESFVKKAVEFLRAKINLLIIDLFPPTRRDPPLAATYELTWNVCPKPLRNAVLAGGKA
jgi:hypothetical protein